MQLAGMVGKRGVEWLPVWAEKVSTIREELTPTWHD